MRFHVVAVFAAFLAAQMPAARTLDIYVVDVEGGNATLLVSPSGESLLIDTGNAGAGAVRDADRIMAAAKDAGLTQIDHLITTHWHGDHFGGMAELAARIPIRTLHRPRPERAARRRRREFLQKTYPQLYAKAKHTVAKPGRQDCRRRPRRARRDVRRRDDQDAAARRRRGEPVLRELQARREQRRGSDVGRRPRHLRTLPHDSPGRPDEEQGVRADVPEQPHRHG